MMPMGASRAISVRHKRGSFQGARRTIVTPQSFQRWRGILKQEEKLENDGYPAEFPKGKIELRGKATECWWKVHGIAGSAKGWTSSDTCDLEAKDLI